MYVHKHFSKCKQKFSVAIIKCTAYSIMVHVLVKTIYIFQREWYENTLALFEFSYIIANNINISMIILIMDNN